jgi:hypothetical protein
MLVSFAVPRSVKFVQAEHGAKEKPLLQKIRNGGGGSSDAFVNAALSPQLFGPSALAVGEEVVHRARLFGW